ncbi:MAG: hypothetical protein JO254_03105 [Pseudolabrys sp.]|nr:hypothetical protein [Pseudolabrys sp.]
MAGVVRARFHFWCPECGFGDAEFGHLLTADEIYCVVCLEETQTHVRLHRWPPEDAVQPAHSEPAS